MTFTEAEIKDAQLIVDYNDEWQFEDDDKTVSVHFYGLEKYVRRIFDLEDDYGEDWIDCYATIDPIREVVTEIFLQFTSNCDQDVVPDRELQIKITNYPEGKMLLKEMMENDKDVGGFIRFIEEAKKEYSE